MKILNLEIFKFRNYEYLNFKPDINLNLILGENAMGKTNFLEAIYMLTFGKSFRTSRDKDLIKIGSNNTILKSKVLNFEYEDELEVEIELQGSNKFKINEKQESIKKYKKNFSSVIFSPADLNMIKQSPNERRKYLDDLISIISPVYEHNLSCYKKIVFQRNRLLKNNLKENNSKNLLEVYNFQLANYGIKLLKERLKIIRIFEKFCKHHFKVLSGGDDFKITYLSTIAFNLEEDIGKTFKESLNKALTSDLEKRITTIGPHRDDLDFKINGLSAKNYASQGEIRTAVLSLKLSEIDLIKEYKKNNPILLLDDVFSELDKNRISYLINNISNTQTFITSTSYDFKISDLKGSIYEVKEGKIFNIDRRMK
ncbi:DNA replication and repair protein RecF [Peptoniphilus sp. ING2-D1G]|nr:DNA replication and repair protein RecF [Peptoniphilus sp. ING2-D1G]